MFMEGKQKAKSQCIQFVKDDLSKKKIVEQ